MHRILMPIFTFALITVPANAQSLVQEKLDMERADEPLPPRSRRAVENKTNTLALRNTL